MLSGIGGDGGLWTNEEDVEDGGREETADLMPEIEREV